MPAPAASTTLTDPAPTAPGERLVTLDVLRGFALAGIILFNVLNYAPRPLSTADRVVAGLVSVLVEGSFYPLFSLLFGVGFGIFLERAAARGAPGAALYLRRLLALLAIAMLQTVLLEERNILLRYALLGVPLLLFWRAGARASFGAAVIALVLALAHGPLYRAHEERKLRDPIAVVRRDQDAAAKRAEGQRLRARYEAAVETRSYVAMVELRALRVPMQLELSANPLRNPTLIHIFAMFLLGAAAWRAGVLRDPRRYRRSLQQLAGSAALIGLAGNIAVWAARLKPARGPLVDSEAWGMVIAVLADTALTLAYAAGLVVLVSGERVGRWAPRIMHLAPIGRMGLTNYLWQSLVMSLLFLPYGFALQRELPVWTCALIGLAIFCSHLPISAWWLHRYQHGPVEWAWRALTYLRPPVMRRAPVHAGSSRQAVRMP